MQTANDGSTQHVGEEAAQEAAQQRRSAKELAAEQTAILVATLSDTSLPPGVTVADVQIAEHRLTRLYAAVKQHPARRFDVSSMQLDECPHCNRVAGHRATASTVSVHRKTLQHWQVHRVCVYCGGETLLESAGAWVWVSYRPTFRTKRGVNDGRALRRVRELLSGRSGDRKQVTPIVSLGIPACCEEYALTCGVCGLGVVRRMEEVEGERGVWVWKCAQTGCGRMTVAPGYLQLEPSA